MSVHAGTIQETTAFFPVSPSQLPRLERTSTLADQASAGFAVLPPDKGGAVLQPVGRRFKRSGAESDAPVLPICGQAPDANSLGCYNLGTGEMLADIPMPGQLTTTPQFFEGSWYIGTSRGFFIRYDSSGVFYTPNFGIASLFFHGPDSKLVMKSLSSSAAATVSGNSESPQQTLKTGFRGTWNWYATANAEFIGTPQFGGGNVFVLTANQSLNSYDIQSGRLNWGVRLAPEVQLRLTSYSLLLHERGLIVGTSDGNLLLLDPKNGQTIWRHTLSAAASDRFSTIAAPVLALSDGIIVTNAESVTQRLNWETRSVKWSYPVGSVVQPKYDEGSVFVAGTDGAVHKLDLASGQALWKAQIPTTSPLVAMTLLKKKDIVLVATANGNLFAIGMKLGSLEGVSPTSTFGAVTGDFFAGRPEQNEVCLSYRTPGYACWTWNSESRKSPDEK
jgi:outer membrane protein assembly factor BamB